MHRFFLLLRHNFCFGVHTCARARARTCRTCGRVACDDCSSKRIRGDRTCSLCWDRIGRKLSGLGLPSSDNAAGAAGAAAAGAAAGGARKSALVLLLEVGSPRVVIGLGWRWRLLCFRHDLPVCCAVAIQCASCVVFTAVTAVLLCLTIFIEDISLVAVLCCMPYHLFYVLQFASWGSAV